MSRPDRIEKPSNAVVVECDLPHSPEKLWRALTTPELLAAWLAPNDIEPKKGARFTLRPKDGEEIDCEVVEVRHERRLSFTWRIGETAPTVVTFELNPTRTGTAFRLAHTGFPLASAQPLRAVAASPRRAIPPRPRTMRIPQINRTRMQWAA